MIKLENVYKIYKLGKAEVVALKNVNLEIESGDYISIMGPSGSGKSTLMNIIGCLDMPTKGKVYIDGRDTTKLSDKELAKIRLKKIGFVFQQFNLIQTLTALENVALPLWFAGVERRKRIKRAKELLKMVGLEGRENHKPRELSGGEQQRVAIARALANDPEVILADEPTGNLDTKTGRRIIEILEKLNKEEGKTLIIVTHDLEIGKRAKKQLKIRDGVLIKDKF